MAWVKAMNPASNEPFSILNAWRTIAGRDDVRSELAWDEPSVLRF
jgi:hypothetical protein